MIDHDFWKGKRVFVTGHTGFKGSWLCLWLHKLGAHVIGYSLEPPTNPNLFELAKIGLLVESNTGDVRDRANLEKILAASEPEIVLHLAAQPLVRDSYKIPVDTYEINVMGTVNILEAIRTKGETVRAFVNVTTDKVYENREWHWGYRENEPLGGYDPYSNSKACSELVTAAYRNSYFNPSDYARHKCAIATARAGNVIGGGDWAGDRIVPDCIRSFSKNETVIIRNPNAIRPWQHVLEPLCGYLTLAQALYRQSGTMAESWNFGPLDSDCVPVGTLVQLLCTAWGNEAHYKIVENQGPHEASFLKLDCSKTGALLLWKPRWRLEKAIQNIASWYKIVLDGSSARAQCFDQIETYEQSSGL